jgi:hypothetical protein
MKLLTILLLLPVTLAAELYAKYSWQGVSKVWGNLCPDKINGTVLLFPGTEIKVDKCFDTVNNCTLAFSCSRDKETKALAAHLSWNGTNCTQEKTIDGPYVLENCSVVYPDKPDYGQCCQ